MGSSDDFGEPPRSGRLPGVVLPPSHRDVDVVAINLQRPSPAASALGGNHNRAASGEGALKIQAHQRLQLDGQDLPVPTCFLRQAVVGEEALHYHDDRAVDLVVEAGSTPEVESRSGRS